MHLGLDRHKTHHRPLHPSAMASASRKRLLLVCTYLRPIHPELGAMLSQSYRRPCGRPNMPGQNGWPVGQFQRNANFITDAKATTYLFLPAAVNRRVSDFADLGYLS